jgi:hypothetical protein
MTIEQIDGLKEWVLQLNSECYKLNGVINLLTNFHEQDKFFAEIRIRAIDSSADGFFQENCLFKELKPFLIQYQSKLENIIFDTMYALSANGVSRDELTAFVREKIHGLENVHDKSIIGRGGITNE